MFKTNKIQSYTKYSVYNKKNLTFSELLGQNQTATTARPSYMSQRTFRTFCPSPPLLSPRYGPDKAKYSFYFRIYCINYDYN